MKTTSEDIIAEIISPLEEKREILEYSGAPDYLITLQGEFSPFQSTLPKALRSKYRLSWSADERLSRDWKVLDNKTDEAPKALGTPETLETLTPGAAE
ncbi:hypothetical protein [Acidithiobacillus albertensis]|uniref:hypothetical protein n=1 Tax=Acidithiobacillus albertensis TaxID=119978 RepID=UPI001C06D6EB|nr:hypothetical protein [Acidithiobacillus albertensis]MBU2741266.1 hypothetical protein [Acidithiobacillus albertensis]